MSAGTRETAWRVFSSELNTASYEIKAEAEKMPSYQLSRLGAMINRVLIAGVLTEKENVGSPEEPLWRGRIQDVASGTVYINIGRYQPEAAAAMVDIEPPWSERSNPTPRKTRGHMCQYVRRGSSPSMRTPRESGSSTPPDPHGRDWST